MASQQLRRESVEEGKVPKLTSHFECLVEKTPEEGHAAGGRRPAPSLEEISDLRSQAQQNSVDDVSAAEERYQMAKRLGLVVDKDKEGDRRSVEDKDVILNQQARRGYAADEDKDIVSSQTATDEGHQARDYARQKAAEGEDVVISSKATDMKNTATARGQQATNTAVDTTKNAAGILSQKAAAAKDTTVEVGKGAAEYAGKVAAGVKVQATVAGWGAAQYALEMAAEGTKKAAGLTSSVAGYTGKTALAAKDKVAGAGQTAAGYAGEKLAQVTEAVVEREKKAAEYAARKKADARIKTSAPNEEDGAGGDARRSEWEAKWESDINRPLVQEEEGEGEAFYGGTVEDREGRGGIVKAIGETLVEIGQTTTDLLTGGGPGREGMVRRREGYKSE